MKRMKELNDSEEYKDAFKSCFNLLLYGTGYGVVRNGIGFWMSGTGERFDFSSFLGDSVMKGVRLTAFPITEKLAYAAFRPNLNTFAKWVPWTIGTTVVSSAIIPAARSVFCKKRETTDSDGFWHKVPLEIGFNVGHGFADMFLPRSAELGGKFIRTTAALMAGHFGSAVCGAPRFMIKDHVSVRQIATALLVMLPMTAVENAVYLSSRSILKPLALR
jgi:hypothetical protein